MTQHDAGDWHRAMLHALVDGGVRHLPYVPDGVLAPLVAAAHDMPEVRAFPVCREEEGVGIAVGIGLAGERAALLLQDTGLGNSLNAIGSLALAQRVPLLLVVSERGGLGEIVSTQLPFGRAVPRILDALGVVHHPLRPTDDVGAVTAGAITTAYVSRTTVALRLGRQLSSVAA